MAWYDDVWDGATDWADSDFGVLDVALPFYGATHALAKGAKWAGDKVSDGVGGGGGSGDFKPYSGGDAANFRYGGDPNAPNAAVGAAAQKAWETGDYGASMGESGLNFGQGVNQQGQALLGQRTNDAVHFDNRAVQQGDWAPQNATLGRLGGLEATQGPSAAQAQLQQGTNQALSSQVALARSGRGFGGNAAAMGQAQANTAGIQANQANAAASLAAQENAAWRGRQAQNLGNVAGMQGQQSQADLGAAVQGRSQNDAMTSGMLGMGQDAWQTGANAGMQGYGIGMQGVGANFTGQGLAHDIRGAEMAGNTAFEDAKMRAWAAENGYTLTQQQLANQKEAGYVSAAATGVTAAAASDIRAKKHIRSGRGQGASFARGLDFDGEIYRPAGMGGSNERAEGFRGASARMPDQEFANNDPEAFDNYADHNGYSRSPVDEEMAALTPMQAQFMSNPESRPDVRPPDTASLDAVREAPGSFYEYKNPEQPGAAPGQHYGPMAQDLAKTPAGASAVVKKPDGSLGVDTGRLALVNTGALSEQQRELDELKRQIEQFSAQPSADYPRPSRASF